MIVKSFRKLLLPLVVIAAGVIISLVIYSSRQTDTYVNVTSENLPRKIVFNNKVYIPAKCVKDSSASVTRIGVSDEGMTVFISETDEIPGGVAKEQGILIKRNDGNYQCYMFSLF